MSNQDINNRNVNIENLINPNHFEVKKKKFIPFNSYDLCKFLYPEFVKEREELHGLQRGGSNAVISIKWKAKNQTEKDNY